MSASANIRLGVNIDHVATIRNARGVQYPDPVRAAVLAIEAGADGITAHLREDRRHIRDIDIESLKRHISRPLNMEMAATQEMLALALEHKPHACCIVPEKREELTTEGGLDVIAGTENLRVIIPRLKGAGIKVSLFVDPDISQIKRASDLDADIVELHTGTYCHAGLVENNTLEKEELLRLQKGAAYAVSVGLEVHGGHGLTYDNVMPIASIPEIAELNIGHFLIAESVFLGLTGAVAEMKQLMKQARDRI